MSNPPTDSDDCGNEEYNGGGGGGGGGSGGGVGKPICPEHSNSSDFMEDQRNPPEVGGLVDCLQATIATAAAAVAEMLGV